MSHPNMSAFAIREIEERFGEIIIRDHPRSHEEHSDSDEAREEKPDGIPPAETQYQAQFMSAA
jgi:hypothetical protein